MLEAQKVSSKSTEREVVTYATRMVLRTRPLSRKYCDWIDSARLGKSVAGS